MKASTKPSAQQADQIVFPARIPPLAVFFVAAPLGTIMAIAVVLFTYKLPMLLIILLGLVGISCIALIKEAVVHLGPTTLEMTGQGLVIKRMLGSECYSWSQIDKVKLVDPGPSYSDSRHEEGRAGIGLFLRGAETKERAPEAEPDVILICRSAVDAGPVILACERIATVKRMSVNGRDPKRTGGMAGKQGKSFRRTTAAA